MPISFTPTASHCLTFLHVPSPLPALASLPARPPDRVEPTPRCSVLPPAAVTGFPTTPCSGSRTTPGPALTCTPPQAALCHAVKLCTSWDHPPHPSLCLSLADTPPHHSTCKMPKLEVSPAQESLRVLQPRRLPPLLRSAAEQSTEQSTALLLRVSQMDRESRVSAP